MQLDDWRRGEKSVCTGTSLNVVQDHDAGPLLGYFGQRLNFGSYSVREEVDARDSNWVLVTGQLGVWSRALGTPAATSLRI